MKSRCIEIPVLAKYIEGRLSDKDRDRIEEHLSECDTCLEEFVIANTLLNDHALIECEPVSEKVALSALKSLNIPKELKKFYAWITKVLVPDSAGQSAFATVRKSDAASSVDYISIKKHMNDLQVEMYIEKTEDDKTRIRVRVHKDNISARNVRLTLIGQGGVIVSRFLKEDYVLFEELLFGSYRFVVEQDALEKGEYLFKINEAGLNEE